MRGEGSGVWEPEEAPFEVELSDEAFYGYVAISGAKAFGRVDHDLGLLATSPYLGRAYDPAYDAARPSFACRVLHCGNYGIYYSVDEAARLVFVFAIEDQRRNPAERFARLEGR